MILAGRAQQGAQLSRPQRHPEGWGCRPPTPKQLSRHLLLAGPRVCRLTGRKLSGFEVAGCEPAHVFERNGISDEGNRIELPHSARADYRLGPNPNTWEARALCTNAHFIPFVQDSAC